MKKPIAYFFALSFILLSIEGCNQPLDITPSGRTSYDEIFSKSVSTRSFLNTVYSYIPRYGNRYYLHTLLAGITDNAYDGDAIVANSNIISSSWNNGELTPRTNPLNYAGGAGGNYNAYFYGRMWQGIRKANVFIANIDDATLKIESDRPRLRAEAHILRAFYYLELIKAYGGMPIIHKPLSVGFDFKSLERQSFDKVVTQSIVKDCDSALAVSALPYRISKADEAGRFTKAVAYAIKSEALLYNASPLWNPDNDISKWKAAAKASKEAIDVLTGVGYELYPNYEEYFFQPTDYSNSPSDTETILEISGRAYPTGAFDKFPFTNQMPIEGLHNLTAGIEPSQELVDAYNMQTTGERPILGYNDETQLEPIINNSSGYDPNDPYQDRDPRFYATVWYNGANYGMVNGNAVTIETFVGGNQGFRIDDRKYTNTGYYLRKFIDPSLRGGNGSNSQATWKKYRLAEIYLNYAEAANEANGPTQEVYNAIKTVRDRVNMPEFQTGLSKKEMRARIRNERRVELAMEEHRFWDVRRWKILNKTGKSVTGMKISKNSDNGNLSYERVKVDERVSWKDKYLIFPIPLTEIVKTGLQQNPGW